ncbi:MAG: hypothetical protein VXZ39_14495 [Planctomycetota bacterium]|nr:hypothetical protein [Planctomycetota bacterium]MEC8496136.1 hypothetical protein [Planctomycetota bacterium]MEC8512036.1 hypothetical protein [Planctomycetota bacterium]
MIELGLADPPLGIPPEAGFLAALLTTVGFLIGAAITGRRRRIGAHARFVLAAVASLGVAIWFALALGELYDLEAAGDITPIHLGLARATTAVYLWPLLTGPLAYKGLIPSGVHRTGAWLALVMTVAATVTGVMMLLGAERLP